MASTTYRIGELASQSGLTPDALRYYERLGLLPPTQRTSGGFRVYPPETVDRIRFIKQAQALGLTLHEIAALVGYQQQGGLKRCRQVRDLLRVKLTDLDAKMAALQEFQKTLSTYLGECERTLSSKGNAEQGADASCPVIDDLKFKRR